MPALKTNLDGSPHVHTYMRADLKYNKKDPQRYRCVDPRCTHTANRKDLKGKLAICAVCKTTEIILNHERLKLSKPSCETCSKSKKGKQHLAILEKLNEIELPGGD